MPLTTKEFGNKIALAALEIGAIRLSPTEPFNWASGYRMPIYNDNRLLLGSYQNRMLIGSGFEHLIKTEEIPYDVIAGTSTAGIAPATTLSNILKCPLIYIREKPKTHGLKKQIEGILLDKQKVVVIEDLVSTGGSSIKAVEGVRNSGGVVDNCLSIFNYGFKETETLFKQANCRLISLLTYNDLLDIAVENGYIAGESLSMLREWRNSPFEWGAKHGFPKVEGG